MKQFRFVCYRDLLDCGYLFVPTEHSRAFFHGAQRADDIARRGHRFSVGIIQADCPKVFAFAFLFLHGVCIVQPMQER